jgi:OmpA-OmpF porin, OOP family
MKMILKQWLPRAVLCAMVAGVGSAYAQSGAGDMGVDGPASMGAADPTLGPSSAGTPSMGSSGMSSTGSSSSGFGSDGYSLLPYTQRGYIGINVGRPNYQTSCGNGLFTCENPKAAVKVYTGGFFNQYLGLEAGYLNMGQSKRAGGSTRADGVNLSLVGRMPISTSFSVFAKAGATYGRTRVSSAVGSGLVAGKERGWGGSYGAGVSFDFTPQHAVVLEWEQHSFKFANQGRQAVRNTSLGYVYKF